MKKIVTIGGGTGTFTVLSGLKKYPLDLTAIVTMADSGGSTGRLRDEFGYLPVGDVRMALAALAEDNEATYLLRELFLYRFDQGEKGLRGHNFGNLFLIALSDILGSQEKAITYASEVLRIKGNVLPITADNVHLVAQYEDGSIIKGETFIDEPPAAHDATLRIQKLSVDPQAQITPYARDAISQADFIILGPGDLYTSVLANIVVNGTSNAIQESSAKLIFIVNLMTKMGQTHNFSAQDHVNEITKYTRREPDYVLVNSASIPFRILRKYESYENAYPVKDDLGKDPRVIRTDLLASKEVQKSSGDLIKRSLIRHDSDKIAQCIMNIVQTR
jgi:uncharacterized cofD-like protein